MEAATPQGGPLGGTQGEHPAIAALLAEVDAAAAVGGAAAVVVVVVPAAGRGLLAARALAAQALTVPL